MSYSIDKIMKKKIKSGKDTVMPLDILRSKNNLDIMSLEEFLTVYNPDKEAFTLKELVYKLESNCKIFTKDKVHGEAQVTDTYILEKLSRHFTELKEGAKKNTVNNRKYKIFFAVDNRDIDSYATQENLKVLRNANKKRKNILKARYTYENSLNRIHGFIILDDSSCLCKPKKSKYLNIVIICANPHSSKSDIKAVGSYLLLFSIIMAYQYKFNKLILEVTNDENDIDSALKEEEDSESEEEDSESEEEEDDSSGDEKDDSSGDEKDDSSGDEKDDSSGDEEDDSSGDEEDDSSADEEDDSSGDEEDDSSPDEDNDENKKCCSINIINNIKCNEDYEENNSKDKYEFRSRKIELEKHNIDDLFELSICYDIDITDYYNKLPINKIQLLLKSHRIKCTLKKKSALIKKLEDFELSNDVLFKKRLISFILDFEYWNFNEYEDVYENITCDSDWNLEGLDPKIHGYGGENYIKGKDSTKDLYCKFYERHGFIEDSALNLTEKCFKRDPLPSMHIILKDNKLENLLKVFIDRKYYQQTSDYCGANIPANKLVMD